LTTEKRLVAPTPKIAPVIVCVVETGIPAQVTAKRVIAPAVSAQNPPNGLLFGNLFLIVLTNRQPLKRVPKQIARFAERANYIGITGNFPPEPLIDLRKTNCQSHHHYPH
jgi:hypothetical protein